MNRVWERKRRIGHLDFATAIAAKPKNSIPNRRKTRRTNLLKQGFARAWASLLRWRIPATALVKVYAVWKDGLLTPLDLGSSESHNATNSERDAASINADGGSECASTAVPAESAALNRARRKKRRREYLRKMATAVTLANVSSWVLACSLCLAGFIVDYLGSVSEIPNYSRRGLPQPIQEDVTFFKILLAICGVGTYVSWRITTKAHRAVKSLPYVQPVTFCNLPAEEVLVRMAEEPSAPSETLLRATVKGEETKAEELLRVASGATRGQGE